MQGRHRSPLLYSNGVNQKEDLLRPLLGGVDKGVSLYPVMTGYLAAFLGGPVAAAFVALLNSARLRRLKRDWPIAVLALAVEAAYLQWRASGGIARLQAFTGGIPEWLPHRLLALAFFALLYAAHRTYYRNMAIVGMKSPNGWLAGIGAIVVGVFAQMAMKAWIAQ